MSLLPLLLLSFVAVTVRVVNGLGACCIGTQCIAASADEYTCTSSYQGVFAGEGRGCPACSDALLPCCNGNNGQCTASTMTPADCANAGGQSTYACHESTNECLSAEQAAATTTTTTTTTTEPVPMGACCYPDTGTSDYACGVSTASHCQSSVQGSVYLGDSSHCGPPTPCTGACCADGACHDGKTPTQCAELDDNSNFLGVNTQCSSLPDAVCGGACCLSDGSACLVATSAQHCVEDYSGVYGGNGVACASQPCKGACCSDTSCEDGVTKSQCEDGSGQLLGAAFRGVGTKCTSPYVCGGACCDDSADTTTCAIAYSDTECVSAGKRWTDYGTACDNGNGCVRLGACCLGDEENGVQPLCIQAEGEEHCSTLGGAWIDYDTPCGQSANVYDENSLCYIATNEPTTTPTRTPTQSPTESPTKTPTHSPTKSPTTTPTQNPTQSPTSQPTKAPSQSPTLQPSASPTRSPTKSPTSPTPKPTILSAQLLQAITHQSLARELQRSGHLTSNHTLDPSAVGACCHPADVCQDVNQIDCAAAGGYFRGGNTTCNTTDVCARCLPCVLDPEETGHCPLRLYNAFASSASHTSSSHHHHHHSHSHSHYIHHRDDECSSPQICSADYGRCFIDATLRVDEPNAPRVCGGPDTQNQACAAELGDGKCGIGVCHPDPQFGAFGQMACLDLREFPCGCRCYDDSALACGSARGVVFDDVNQDGVRQLPAEAPISGAVLGIYLDTSGFTLPPTTPPLAIRVTDEHGTYVFSSLAEGRYHVVIISLPAPYVTTSHTPSMRTADIECPGITSHEEYYDDDDDDSVHDDYHYSTARRLVRSGGTLSSVESAAHLDLDNDFGVASALFITGRVVVDANSDNVAQPSEQGIGHATIRALLHPTMSEQATAVSSVADGSFTFSNLPQGTYDFEEIDPPGYRSTGDSVGNNDNTIPNVLVSNSVGNVTSGIDFFDERLPATTSDDDDDDDLDHCHNVFTWFFTSECVDHVTDDHPTTILLSAIVLFGLCLAVCCCIALCVFGGSVMRRGVTGVMIGGRAESALVAGNGGAAEEQEDQQLRRRKQQSATAKRSKSSPEPPPAEQTTVPKARTTIFTQQAFNARIRKVKEKRNMFSDIAASGGGGGGGGGGGKR